jgi:hypothetical protein
MSQFGAPFFFWAKYRQQATLPKFSGENPPFSELKINSPDCAPF